MWYAKSVPAGMRPRGHRWRFLRLAVGPRGAHIIWQECRRCGFIGHHAQFSRGRVPRCTAGEIFDPGAILAIERVMAHNRGKIEPHISWDEFNAKQLTIWNESGLCPGAPSGAKPEVWITKTHELPGILYVKNNVQRQPWHQVTKAFGP